MRVSPFMSTRCLPQGANCYRIEQSTAEGDRVVCKVKCEALWSSISAIVQGVSTHPKQGGGSKAGGTKAAPRARTTAKK